MNNMVARGCGPSYTPSRRAVVHHLQQRWGHVRDSKRHGAGRRRQRCRLLLLEESLVLLLLMLVLLLLLLLVLLLVLLLLYECGHG